MIERIHVTRRGLVRAMLLAGGLTHAIRSAGAISRRPLQAGVQKFQGVFKLNNRPARLGQIVNPGDMATTGHGSSAIIIIGQHGARIGKKMFEPDGFNPLETIGEAALTPHENFKTWRFRAELVLKVNLLIDRVPDDRNQRRFKSGFESSGMKKNA